MKGEHTDGVRAALRKMNKHNGDEEGKDQSQLHNEELHNWNFTDP